MPTLNFQPRFAPLVESGEKRCTIRAFRRDGRDPKPDDVLHLFTGMRTKRCRKLREDVCIDVSTIHITRRSVVIVQRNLPAVTLSPAGRVSLAQSDGFADWAEMRDWFDQVHGLPFSGLLIEW